MCLNFCGMAKKLPSAIALVALVNLEDLVLEKSMLAWEQVQDS